jgi:hypothetical protein
LLHQQLQELLQIQKTYSDENEPKQKRSKQETY